VSLADYIKAANAAVTAVKSSVAPAAASNSSSNWYSVLKSQSGKPGWLDKVLSWLKAK